MPRPDPQTLKIGASWKLNLLVSNLKAFSLINLPASLTFNKKVVNSSLEYSPFYILINYFWAIFLCIKLNRNQNRKIPLFNFELISLCYGVLERKY